MKKYFLKGKEYLNKKLEELDIDKTEVDYITDQIPNKLRKPLSTLRYTQIDLEDTHQYQTYFKNYPNHHISHFLLDKYLIQTQKQSQQYKYLPPPNQNTFVPPFDIQLQQKALSFKEAVDQYDEGYAEEDEPLVCMCVIHFHHKRGTQVEYYYPQNSTVEKIMDMIVHHAMPDSSHNKHEDSNFFNFETQFKGKNRMLFGVSYFKQIKLTEQMKNKNPELTRSYLQKAVAVLSTLPLFGYLRTKIQMTTQVFFTQLSNFDIINLAFKNIRQQLIQAWPQMQLTDFNIKSDLKATINLFGVSEFYEIWKSVLHQKKVVVFANSSSSASQFILSLISLFPGLNTFGLFSRPVSKYMQSLRQYGLPLRLFSSKNFISMSFHIQDFHLLSKFSKTDEGNFLLGTTNRLLKQTNNNFGIQLFVNLQNGTIQKRKARKSWEGLSKKQKKFIAQLQELVNYTKNISLEEIEDRIRNLFHSFLKEVLIQMIKSIRQFRKFVKDCDEYSKKVNNPQEKIVKKSSYQYMHDEIDPEQSEQKCQNKNEFPPLLPNQVIQMVFPQLLMNRSFGYFLQFHNQNLPEIIKGQFFPYLHINNYDYFLRIDKDQFIYYNWLTKKLAFGNGENNKNFQGKEIQFLGVTQNMQKDSQYKNEAKSIYIGNVYHGKFHKNGFYVDKNEHFEGQYCMGGKEGYGKYTTSYEKYIGDFKNNLYDGSGQLIIGEDIYVGQFKQGLRNGFGCNQGTFNFEGYWQNDKPMQQNSKQVYEKETNKQECSKQEESMKKETDKIE